MESWSDHSIHIPLDGSVVFDHVLGHPVRTSRTFLVVEVNGPVQFFSCLSNTPLLCCNCGEHWMFNGENERTTRREPTYNITAHRVEGSDIVQDE